MEAIRDDVTGSWHVYDDQNAVGRVDPVFDGYGPKGYSVMIIGSEYSVKHPDTFTDLGAAFETLWKGYLNRLEAVSGQIS